MRRGSDYRQRPSHQAGGRVKRIVSIVQCLNRLEKVEQQVRTLSQTLKDYNVRLVKLERRE